MSLRKLANKEQRETLRAEFYASIERRDPRPLSEIVRDLRRIVGFSRAQLAARVGVSEESLKRIEQGRANPTVETIEKIISLGGLTLTVRTLSTEEILERRRGIK